MPQVSDGPKGLNDILESAYASALKQDKTKASASAIAWAAAKDQYKKKGGRWVSKLYVDTGKLVLAKRALLRSVGGTVKMVECMRIPSEELMKFMKGDSLDSDVEMLVMSEVLVNPYNREVDRAKVNAIKESVKGSGAVKPVVYSEVDRDGAPAKMITDGHHRYVALKELGYAEIPARMSDEDGLDTTADDEPVKLRKEIVTSDVAGLELTRQDLGVRRGPKPYRRLPEAKMNKGGPGSGCQGPNCGRPSKGVKIEGLSNLAQQARKYKTPEEFYERAIKPLDNYAPEYRNPIIDNWRETKMKPLSSEAGKKGVVFSTNPIQLESSLDNVLKEKYSEKELSNMSVSQKSTEVLGKEWTSKYKIDILEGGSPFALIENFWNEAHRNIGKGASDSDGWSMGRRRPFKFDPNSTENEGRYRLYPPSMLDNFFRRKSSTDGVSYVMGTPNREGEKKEPVVQALRFDRNKFDEVSARSWWEENKGKYRFYGEVKKVGWTDEAREAALESRRAKAGGARDTEGSKDIEQLVEGRARTLEEYNKLRTDRQNIISENRARRLRGGERKPPIPVPPEPKKPLVPIAYDKEGNYLGRLQSEDEAPKGSEIRWEEELGKGGPGSGRHPENPYGRHDELTAQIGQHKADLKAGKIDMATFTQRTQPLYNLQARLRDKAESMGEKVGAIRVPFGKYHSAEIVDFDKPFESGVEVQEFLRSNDVVMCSVDENTSSLDKNELRRLVFEQYLDDNNMLYKKGFGPQGQASYMIKVCGKNEVDAVRVHLNKKYNQPGLISVIGGMISFYYSNSVEYRGSLSKMCAGTGLTDNYYCFDGQKFRI